MRSKIMMVLLVLLTFPSWADQVTGTVEFVQFNKVRDLTLWEMGRTKEITPKGVAEFRLFDGFAIYSPSKKQIRVALFPARLSVPERKRLIKKAADGPAYGGMMGEWDRPYVQKVIRLKKKAKAFTNKEVETTFLSTRGTAADGSLQSFRRKFSFPKMPRGDKPVGTKLGMISWSEKIDTSVSGSQFWKMDANYRVNVTVYMGK